MGEGGKGGLFIGSRAFCLRLDPFSEVSGSRVGYFNI